MAWAYSFPTTVALTVILTLTLTLAIISHSAVEAAAARAMAWHALSRRQFVASHVTSYHITPLHSTLPLQLLSPYLRSIFAAAHFMSRHRGYSVLKPKTEIEIPTMMYDSFHTVPSLHEPPSMSMCLRHSHCFLDVRRACFLSFWF